MAKTKSKASPASPPKTFRAPTPDDWEDLAQEFSTIADSPGPPTLANLSARLKETQLSWDAEEIWLAVDRLILKAAKLSACAQQGGVKLPGMEALKPSYIRTAIDVMEDQGRAPVTPDINWDRIKRGRPGGFGDCRDYYVPTCLDRESPMGLAVIMWSEILSQIVMAYPDSFEHGALHHVTKAMIHPDVQVGFDAIPLKSDFVRSWAKTYSRICAKACRKLVTMAKQGQRAPAGDEASTKASDDFTSVTWYGKQYKFAKGQQADAVRVLWQAWQNGNQSLSQGTIHDRIESSADRFVLAKVFRSRKPGGSYMKHPAWGTMIVSSGKGTYMLAKPKPR